jgi:hypothetical protein
MSVFYTYVNLNIMIETCLLIINNSTGTTAENAEKGGTRFRF